MDFKNPDTAAKFKSLVTKDRRITIPGKYSGLLSNIDPENAQVMVDMGDNQVAPIKAPKQPETPAPVKETRETKDK